MFRSVYWYLFTDVSGQFVGPVFKNKAVQEYLLGCLALEDGNNKLSLDVRK
jgi:hypothetical protein